MLEHQEKHGASKLQEYLSPISAWAFSLGTSIGWGSFVITSNTYLMDAGPAGSVLGMLISAAVMLVIAKNYHYLMNRHPDAGGVYSYTKFSFGHDYGFLTAWFLALTYMAILWANSTSIPLFARYLIGNVFQVGLHYTVFGYEVFLGEILLSIIAVLVIGVVCIAAKRFASAFMAVLGITIVAGISLCFFGAMAGTQGNVGVFDPVFAPTGNEFFQVITIACISPWAFIGFESISQSTEEFAFPRSKSFKVLATAVVLTTALYIFVIVLSVTTYPPQFESWFDYIQNLNTMKGIEGLPPFYAAKHYLGDAGVYILFVALFALIATSLIGNITALSRLFYALSKDGILPKQLSELNGNGVPSKAIIVIIAVSCVIPFLGRTAIGWIVDVTTIGATITYGFVSAAAYKTAKEQGDTVEKSTGAIGLAVMVAMGALLILPNLFMASSMATESYFLFIVWSLLGLIVFHRILRVDPENRFGESVIVWIALLAFVMFMSFVWMEQSSENVAIESMGEVRAHYSETVSYVEGEDAYFTSEVQKIHGVDTVNTIIVLLLYAVSFGILISNYSFMRQKQLEGELLLGVERMRADTDVLTGVRNKTAYTEMERELERKLDSGEVEEFAIVLFDLNDLKIINDTKGHTSGDEYLRSACQIICHTFKHSPVFRIGGDEFVAILDGVDYTSCDELAGSIAELSRENCESGGVVIAVGAAKYDSRKDSSVISVYDRADRLMYEHKRALKDLAAKPSKTQE